MESRWRSLTPCTAMCDSPRAVWIRCALPDFSPALCASKGSFQGPKSTKEPSPGTLLRLLADGGASRLSGHRWFCTRGRGRCRGISSLRTLKVVLPRRCVQASAPRSAVYGRDMGPCLSFPWLSRVHRIPVAPASMYPVSPESLKKMA